VPAPLLPPLGTSQLCAGTPSTSLGNSPAPCWHPTILVPPASRPKGSAHPPPGLSPPAPGSGQLPPPPGPVPSLQVIKQRRGQDKLPPGLCARRKSNGRKRESSGSQGQRVRFLGGSGRQLPSAARPGIVLPGAWPGTAAPGGLLLRSAPPAWQSCPFGDSTAPLPSGRAAQPPCHHPFTQRQPLLMKCPSQSRGRPSRSPPPVRPLRRDGLDPGQQLLPSPSSPRARPGDGTRRLPTTRTSSWGPHDAPTPTGSLQCVTPPGGPCDVQSSPWAPRAAQAAPGWAVRRAAARVRAGEDQQQGQTAPAGGSGERVKSPHPRPRHLHEASLVPGRPPSPRHRLKEKPLPTRAGVPTGKTAPATLVPKADFRQLRTRPWAPGLGAARAGHGDPWVPRAGDPARSQLPLEAMKGSFPAPVLPQKSRWVRSKELLGRLSRARRRRRRRMRRDPIVPAEAGPRFAPGSHLHFPSYQHQPTKLGAKTGAALLDYNKKPCEGWGRPGTSAQLRYPLYPARPLGPQPRGPWGDPPPPRVPEPPGWQGTDLGERFLKLQTPLGPFPHEEHPSPARPRAARAAPPAGPGRTQGGLSPALLPSQNTEVMRNVRRTESSAALASTT